MDNSFILNEYKDLEGKRILVAEDDLLNQIIIKKVLDKWHISYDVVDDGQKAIEKISSEIYDIILMDIQMPVMGGYEASRQIRKQNQNIPIIALTASVDEELKDLVKAAGMNDILIKPYSPEALHEMLVNYLK